METLKQDARRFGVAFLNPCVNRSRIACSAEGGSVRVGLQFIKDVGEESAKLIAAERQRQGPYTTAEVEERGEDEPVTVAGWPVARQHPQRRNGTVFVTIEDEMGDTQVILYSDLFAKRRRELGSQVVVVTGRVSKWDGTVNVIATDLRGIHSRVAMPPSHDWR